MLSSRSVVAFTFQIYSFVISQVYDCFNILDSFVVSQVCVYFNALDSFVISQVCDCCNILTQTCCLGSLWLLLCFRHRLAVLMASGRFNALDTDLLS